MQAGNFAKVNAGDDHGAVWGEDVYIVNDDGHVACGRYDMRGRWHEYWFYV